MALTQGPSSVTGTLSGTVDQGDAGTSAWKVDGSGVIQPVSASVLPLPTGAATSANQTAANASLASIDSKLTSPITVTGSLSIAPDVNIHDSSGGNITSTASALDVHVSNTVNAAQSGTWNVTNVSGTVSLPTGAATSAKQPALGTAGSASTDVITVQGITSMTPLKTDGSGVTQPVSGTVTANAGSGTFTIGGTVTANAGTNLNTSALALDTSVNGILVAQGSTTSGQTGPITQTATTTNAPTYTTAKTNPLSTDTSGNLRVSLKDSPANTNKFLVTADPIIFSTPQHIIVDSGTVTTITNVVHVDDNSGSLTVDNNGTFAVQASQSGTWNVTDISGTVSLPTGASTSALQTTGNASLASIDSKLTSPITVTGTVTSSANMTSGTLSYTNGSGSTIIDVTSYTELTLSFHGTWTGTVAWTGGLDPTGANGKVLNAVDTVLLDGNVYTQCAASTAATNTFKINIAGIKYVKLVNIVTTGTAVIEYGASLGTAVLEGINATLFASQAGAWSVGIDSANNSVKLTDGTHTASISASSALKVDGSAVTQPISGSISFTAPQHTIVDSGSITVANSTGASAVNIQDGGNSITVDGAISFTSPQHIIADSGTITTITNVVHVDDNSGSLTVDNAGTFAVQATLAAETTKVIGTVNQGTSPWVTQDSSVGSTAATAPTKAALMGGVFNTSPATITNGQMGQLQLDATQNLLTKINVALPAGTNLVGKVGIDQTTPGTTNGVQVNAALPVGTNVIGKVSIDQTTPGTTNLVALAANQSVNIAQVNGATTVTSVTGVQDIMPRKRTGSTGLSPNYSANRITGKVTTTPTAATAYVSVIAIACSAAGTAWTMVIQNKEATPKILVPSFTLTVPTTGLPIILQFAEPILMTSGIDIVTAGTTAGTVDVYITYWQ